MVKWTLKYLRGATTQTLCFEGSNIVLKGYVDSIMIVDIDSRWSTTIYVLTVSGTTIYWIMELQNVVAL